MTPDLTPADATCATSDNINAIAVEEQKRVIADANRSDVPSDPLGQYADDIASGAIKPQAKSAEPLYQLLGLAHDDKATTQKLLAELPTDALHADYQPTFGALKYQIEHAETFGLTRETFKSWMQEHTKLNGAEIAAQMHVYNKCHMAAAKPSEVPLLLEAVATKTKRANAVKALKQGDVATAVPILRDAGVDTTKLEQAVGKAKQLAPIPAVSLAQLVAEYPALRAPVVNGLLRKGETMNIIAASKAGKSWLVTDLAFSVAMGKPWLDYFATEQGRVLIIDNELHPETIAYRLQTVCNAAGIDLKTAADRIHIIPLRGRLLDLVQLQATIANIPKGKYQMVILDAFYRFVPEGKDENANADIAQLYNRLDHYAAMLDAAFAIVHHESKGKQGDKSITDVGAGAGAQSRAADTHVVFRRHEEPNAVVLEGAVRSWEPLSPLCLRWTYPLWQRATDLDPTKLAGKRSSKVQGPPPKEWTAQEFVETFVDEKPSSRDTIMDKAAKAKISTRTAKGLFAQGIDGGLILKQGTKYARRDDRVV